jgi:hypothetical protein
MHDDDHEQDDERLVDDLRALFARADGVPALVVETAKASLGWRRLDADLAELLSDSALEAGGELALARGQAELRSLSFGAGDLTIDLEIHGESEHRRLLGQISPPVAASIELQPAPAGGDAARAGGDAAPAGGDAAPHAVPALVAQTDALGRFRVALPEASAFRLRILLADRSQGGSAEAIETSWVPL